MVHLTRSARQGHDGAWPSVAECDVEALLAKLGAEPALLHLVYQHRRVHTSSHLHGCALAQQLAEAGKCGQLSVQVSAERTDARKVEGGRDVVDKVSRKRAEQQAGWRVL